MLTVFIEMTAAAAELYAAARARHAAAVVAGEAWAVANPVLSAIGNTAVDTIAATGVGAGVIAGYNGVVDYMKNSVGGLADAANKYGVDKVNNALGTNISGLTPAEIKAGAKDRLNRELDNRLKGKDGKNLAGAGGDIIDAAAVAKAKNAKLTELEKKSLSHLPDRVIVRRLKDRERQAKYRLTHKRLMGKWVAK